MEELMNFLYSALGSHDKVAELLGYDERHYRKIRHKIVAGEKLPARVKFLLEAKAKEFHYAGAGHESR